jgi:hypothetical protein
MAVMTENSGTFYGRRQFLAAGAAMLGLIGAPLRSASAGYAIEVFKDPNCGCCGGWVEHLRQAGFAVTVVETSDLVPIKRRLGVPDDLYACHTAVIEDYVIEGHVPAEDIRRLLAERPKAHGAKVLGLAVPGMPAGSPGMEGGAPEPYAVILFDGEERREFTRYPGEVPV